MEHMRGILTGVSRYIRRVQHLQGFTFCMSCAWEWC